MPQTERSEYSSKHAAAVAGQQYSRTPSAAPPVTAAHQTLLAPTSSCASMHAVYAIAYKVFWAAMPCTPPNKHSN